MADWLYLWLFFFDFVCYIWILCFFLFIIIFFLFKSFLYIFLIIFLIFNILFYIWGLFCIIKLIHLYTIANKKKEFVFELYKKEYYNYIDNVANIDLYNNKITILDFLSFIF